MVKMNGDWIRPRAVGAICGAVAMTIAGFWGLGWTTAGAAEQRARVQSEAAVVSAMVPYCVASARRDPDGAKLTKLGTETSSWTRAQFVRDAGWATMAGSSVPDHLIAEACSEKLKVAKAG